MGQKNSYFWLHFIWDFQNPKKNVAISFGYILVRRHQKLLDADSETTDNTNASQNAMITVLHRDSNPWSEGWISLLFSLM